MFIEIKKWLQKPYPFPSTFKSKFLISLGFGKFVFLFLLIFKPFDFSNLENQMLFFAFFYGVITMCILLINLIIFPLLFKRLFNLNKWNVYKMILFVLVIELFIGIVNTIFSYQSNEIFTEKRYHYFFFISNAFLVGIFPILLYIYITEKISNKKHQSVAEKITEIQKTNITIINNKENELVIHGENKKEQLNLLLKNLLYISYEKNYASIFYLQNDIVKETLLRTSLNKIESQLSNYKSIVRCHKSYIVNTDKVEKIQGNARSYLLNIPNVDLLIPVSRSFPKEMLFTLVK